MREKGKESRDFLFLRDPEESDILMKSKQDKSEKGKTNCDLTD